MGQLMLKFFIGKLHALIFTLRAYLHYWFPTAFGGRDHATKADSFGGFLDEIGGERNLSEIFKRTRC